jgi:hypothetical protein
MLLKQYLKHLSISFILYLVLGMVFYFYLKAKDELHFLDNFHLLRFDAIHYESIKNNGYQDSWLCAFFPAFPYLWKLINCSAALISLFNSILYILSASAISLYYKLDWKRQLFFLTIPSLVFMFVPYTESLFYVVTSLLLIGLKKNNIYLILSGLFLSSLIRPTTFVFIPAIIGTYFFVNHSLKSGVLKSILPIIALSTGLLITITIHFQFTSKWFVFFEAQKLWENYLHFPHLPLRSWGGDGITRYDGSALMVGILCGVYLTYLFTKKLKFELQVSSDLAFSLFYILGTTLIVIAYRDGNLYSLNRFIYATPFMIPVLNYFFNNYTFRPKHLWIMLVVSEIFWLLFNSYNHIHNFLLFSTVSVYFGLLLLAMHKSKIIHTTCMILLILINCVGLIKLFYRFLNGGWVA